MLAHTVIHQQFAPPLMLCGTVELIIGMYSCSHTAGRNTSEESWRVEELDQAGVQVFWLQKVGELTTDSYALFPAEPYRELPISHPRHQ